MAASDNLNGKQFPNQARPLYGDYSGKPYKPVEFAKRPTPLPDFLTSKPKPKKTA